MRPPEDNFVMDSLLSILIWSREEVAEYLALPPLSHLGQNEKETKIPAAYVRAKGTKSFRDSWMKLERATHNLIAEDRTTSMELMYPVHEVDSLVTAEPQLTDQMVLLSQLGKWQNVLQYDAKTIPGFPPLFRLQVPAIDEFDALLFFLHHHDEQHLYDYLLKAWGNGELDGQIRLRGFCLNVRYLGVLDQRINGVVLAVLQPDEMLQRI